MQVDWRRQILQLPSAGEISAPAVRAAYWRLVASGEAVQRERLRDAKRALLHDLGVRLPPPRRAPPGADESQ